jgi:hypothetical protein
MLTGQTRKVAEDSVQNWYCMTLWSGILVTVCRIEVVTKPELELQRQCCCRPSHGSRTQVALAQWMLGQTLRTLSKSSATVEKIEREGVEGVGC